MHVSSSVAPFVSLLLLWGLWLNILKGFLIANRVCQSFCPSVWTWAGVYVSQHAHRQWGVYPIMHLSRGGVDRSVEQERGCGQRDTPRDGNRRCWYASYWNDVMFSIFYAFSTNILYRDISKLKQNTMFGVIHLNSEKSGDQKGHKSTNQRELRVPLCVISVLIKVITILIVKFVASDLNERLKLTCLWHSYSVTKDLSRWILEIISEPSNPSGQGVTSAAWSEQLDNTDTWYLDAIELICFLVN